MTRLPDHILGLLTGIGARRHAWELASAALARRNAPAFNVWTFLRDDELGLSAVIAWMLDPRGSHGQGTRFLDLLCDHYEIDRPPPGQVRVELESPTSLIERDRRKIDIKVTAPGWVLGIENKPSARFQPGQVADYLRQVRAEADGNHRLLVLKGSEGEIPDDQIGPKERAARRDRRLLDSDYVRLRPWLAECARSCEAPRVRWAIEDLMGHVDRTVLGLPGEEEVQVITAGVLDNRDHRTAAFQLVTAAETLLTEVGDRFVEAVRARLPAAKLSLADESATDGSELYAQVGLDIELDDDLPFTFSFNLDKPQLREPYYGLHVRKGEATARVYPHLRERLAEVGLHSQRKHLTYWAWWNYVDPTSFGVHHEDATAAWEGMVDGSLADRLVGRAVEFKSKLRRIGALSWSEFRARTPRS